MKTLFLIMSMICLVGCASIPNGGYHGDISKVGTAGDVLATVKLGQGLLVGTAHLDNGRVVNLQVNKDEVARSDSLHYERTLTIGKFSKILGSGFSRRKNIYYRKRIWYNGKDVFEIDGDKYLVEWRCNYKDPLTYIVADMYIITFRRLAESLNRRYEGLGGLRRN